MSATTTPEPPRARDARPASGQMATRMVVALGLVAARGGAAPVREPAALARSIAPAWRWFLAGALAGYLALMPGMVLAGPWGMASEALVTVLACFAFANLGLALTAARAHDRLLAATG